MYVEALRENFDILENVDCSPDCWSKQCLKNNDQTWRYSMTQYYLCTGGQQLFRFSPALS